MSEARSFTAHRHDYSHSWEVRPFDPSEDRALRRYWTGGLSCGAIAQKLGRSKNSIVARAHRLQLTPRPSPIGPNAKVIRQAFLDAAGLADPVPPKPKPEVHRSATKAVDGPPSVPPAPTPLPSPPASPPTDQVPEQLPPAVRPNLTPPAAFPVFRTCQWFSMSERPWVACGGLCAPGTAWCPDHFARVYVTRQRLRAEAA